MARSSAKYFQFDPIAQLDALASRGDQSNRFTAKTPAQMRAWQRKTRIALARCLGFLDEKPVASRPREIDRADRGSYVRHKIILRTTVDSELPLYLLVPKKIKTPRPCVLALHGHGYGAKDIVSVWEDGSERTLGDGYHREFAADLAERGFVVAAPDISCFGERQIGNLARFGAVGLSGSCHNAATYAFMLGKSIAGLRVLDGMRVLDYLSTRKEIDANHFGVMGISGGGMHAFFSAALDTRIKAAVISGYFCDWRHSILSIFHCTCNFVPGLLRLGELSDLAGLIAPRPLLIENGTHDPIFPIEHVKATVNKARRAWRVMNASDSFATDFFDGRHRIHGEPAYQFLAAHLDLCQSESEHKQ